MAKDHIIFNNNLSNDGTYVAYDSNNSLLKFPTTFKYMKTTNYNNNYGFKLSEVVFTGEVGTRTDFPTLPNVEGQITLSKFAATSSGAPTVDLYFTGNIQKNSIQVFPHYDYDVPSPNKVYMPSPGYNFYSNTGIFPINKVKLTWGRGSGNVTFSPSTFHSDETGGTYTYRYTGDKISFTTNWNSEYNDSNIVSPSTPIEFNGPNVDVTVIPTVYCNWEVLWDYPCTCHIDCSVFCNGHCNTDGGGGGYTEWPGTFIYGYYIRTAPNNTAELVSFSPTNYDVTVTGESGDWYYCAFNTISGTQYGWVFKDGISGDNPNHGGGCTTDECTDDCYDDFYCSNHDCWDHNQCSGHVPGCYSDCYDDCTSNLCPTNF